VGLEVPGVDVPCHERGYMLLTVQHIPGGYSLDPVYSELRGGSHGARNGRSVGSVGSVPRYVPC
jgi:hypothetical protein